MGKIARFIGNLLPFGISATGTHRTVFGDVTQSDVLSDNINADFLVGWENGVDVNGFPLEQYFNAIGFTATQLAAYLHQMGIAEWDNAQEYHFGSLCNVLGVIYRSTIDTNVGNDPTSDLVNWTLAGGANNIVFVDTGSANDYELDSVLGTVANPTAYSDGQFVMFKVATSNTGASTIEIGSLGAKSLTLPGGTALVGGEVIVGQYVGAIFDLSNNRFEILGCGHLDNIIRTSTAGGTVDAITATFAPIVAVLKNEIVLFIDMAGTNATTTPTLQADGTTAKTIVKNGNQALVAGDIPGEAIFKFDTANDVWELLNPAGAPLGTLLDKIVVQDDTQTTWAGSPNNQIPYDATPPLVAEGREIFSQAYDEIASGNTLVIEVIVNMATANFGDHITVTLFDGSTLKALMTRGISDNQQRPIPIRFAVATDGASHTWSVRVGHGSASGALYNNFDGVTTMGGALIFSSIQITEYSGDILI